MWYWIWYTFLNVATCDALVWLSVKCVFYFPPTHYYVIMRHSIQLFCFLLIITMSIVCHAYDKKALCSVKRCFIFGLLMATLCSQNDHRFMCIVPVHAFSITTHLLSIERADWPKLHYMFKARDAKAWQREFPVWVCASNLLLIDIFLDIVARIKMRCVIKAKHICWSVNSFDLSLEKLHSRGSARAIFPAKNRTNKHTNETCFTTYLGGSYANDAFRAYLRVSRHKRFCHVLFFIVIRVCICFAVR